MIGDKKNLFAIGAKVSIKVDGRWQYKTILAGNSFISQDSPELHFGLGSSDTIETLNIVWPDGTKQTIRDVPANKKIEIRK